MYRRQGDYLEGAALGRHAECLAGLGRRGEARDTFQQGLARLRERPGYGNVARFVVARWARFLVEEGLLAEAGVVAEELLFAAEAAGSAKLQATAEAILARADAAAGDVVGALARVEHVLVPAESLSPVETLLDCHAVLAAAGDERACDVLEAARSAHLLVGGSIGDVKVRRLYLEHSSAGRAVLQVESSAVEAAASPSDP